MPLTILLEWVGGTFEKPVWARVAFLALFLTLFWCSELESRVTHVRGAPRRLLGASCLLLGALLAWASVRWLLAARLGLAPLEVPAWLRAEAFRLALPFTAAWPLALGSSLCFERGTGPRSYERLGLLLALACMLHLASDVRVQGLPVLPAAPYVLWVLYGAAALLLACALLPLPYAARLSVVLCVGLTLRALAISAWQVDPRVRDMLALVLSAQDRFASGDNPYALYAMQHGSELPLTYLPGMWLAYGVPRLLALDLRFAGAWLEFALFVLLAITTARIQGDTRREWARAIVLCFAAVWLLSPSVLWNVVYAEPSVWWGLLGITLTLAFAQRYAPAAFALGYTAASRHFAVVLAPFVLVYFVRSLGLRRALPYVGLTVVVALALLSPFVVQEPELFWFGTLRWLREYGPAHLPWFFDRFGFMSLFHEHGAFELLPFAQAAVVLLCLVAAALTKKRARIAPFAATALLLFIMLNVLLWDSFLLDGAIAALGVVLTRPLAGLPARAPVPTAPWQRVWSATLLLALTLGGYLAYTLVTTLRPRGREPTRAFMMAQVAPGDFVIDRSDRHIAFVEGSWLLRQDEVPAPIAGELVEALSRSDGLPHGRLWLITQRTRDRELVASFARLGSEPLEREFGDYRVQAVKPWPTRPTAPLAAAEVRGVACPLHWLRRPMFAVQVQKGSPARIPLAPAPIGKGFVLAAAFPNEEVSWPHESVQVTVRGAGAVLSSLELENLRGYQARSFVLPGDPRQKRALTLELTSEELAPRLVCVELLQLAARD